MGTYNVLWYWKCLIRAFDKRGRSSLRWEVQNVPSQHSGLLGGCVGHVGRVWHLFISCFTDGGVKRWALFWWVAQTLVRGWQQCSCPCATQPPKSYKSHGWVCMNYRFKTCSMPPRGRSGLQSWWQWPLEDPSFWHGAVSGMQDDVMPILKVMLSVPISLTFPPELSLWIILPLCTMSWCGSGISLLESLKVVSLISFHLYTKEEVWSLHLLPWTLTQYICSSLFPFSFPLLILLVLSLYLVWSVHRICLSPSR